jgi:hypothetical protein
MIRWIDRRMTGWIDEWADEQTDGQMDEWWINSNFTVFSLYFSR